MDTYLTVQGNLVADPVARSTAGGATVVGFRIASSGRRFDREAREFRDGDPLFITVSCWRALGANALASLRKGDSVVVLGRLTYRTYDDKNGTRRSVHEIDAIALGPDLARCPADLRRPTPRADSGGGSPASPDPTAPAPPDSAQPSSTQPNPVAA